MNAIIKKLGIQILAIVLIPGIVYCIFIFLRPNAFGKLDTVYLLLLQSIVSCILAWGMSFNMTAGNIDFSLGAEVIMGTLVGALLAKSFGVAGIVIGAMGTVLVIGSIKAIFMGIINMNSMVISIAYTLILGSFGSLIVQGKSLIITSNQTILGNTPWNIIIFLVAGVVMYILQRYSVFGAHCRSLGGNPVLAVTAGINKIKIQGIAIMIASIYCGISAVISLSHGSGAAASTGMNSMTTVFGAMIGVFIAFVLERYINIVFGIFVGVFTMNIISMGLMAVNMPSSLKDSVTGGFLLVLMISSNYKDKIATELLKKNASKARIIHDRKDKL